MLEARVRAPAAACPCGASSARVHGRYVRRLSDAAVGGLGVVIELCVRRFRCENSACPAVTFAEQVAGLTTPHSRYTPLGRGVDADRPGPGGAGGSPPGSPGQCHRGQGHSPAPGQSRTRAGHRGGGSTGRRRLRLPRGPALRHSADRHGHPPAAAPLRRP
ncbi:transposase family protein [Streptomyces sp. NBC_01455]|uniref:transposase family protein n=1 Tax=Streptomyces sp. NBC_01455 TaxID=2903874 RepID=UPI003FCCDEF1